MHKRINSEKPKFAGIEGKTHTHPTNLYSDNASHTAENATILIRFIFNVPKKSAERIVRHSRSNACLIFDDRLQSGWSVLFGSGLVFFFSSVEWIYSLDELDDEAVVSKSKDECMTAILRKVKGADQKSDDDNGCR